MMRRDEVSKSGIVFKDYDEETLYGDLFSEGGLINTMQNSPSVIEFKLKTPTISGRRAIWLCKKRSQLKTFLRTKKPLLCHLSPLSYL